MVVCNDCGSTEVQTRAWVRPNNDDEYVESCEEGEGYCEVCGESDITMVDKAEWDSDNRCNQCDEIHNDHNNECTCTICDHCDENVDAGECECSFCDYCDENRTAEKCECDRCDECEYFTEECQCENDDEDKAVPVAVPPPPIPVGPVYHKMQQDAQDPGMAMFKCGDCSHEFEAISTMTMCESCLSDNIKPL